MNLKELILGFTLSLFTIGSTGCMYEAIPRINILEEKMSNADKMVEINTQTMQETLDSLNFLIEELKIAKQYVNSSKTKEEKAVNQSVFLVVLRRVTDSFSFLLSVADKIASKKFLLGLILTIGPIVSIYGKYINPDFFPGLFNHLGEKASEGAVDVVINTSAGLVKGTIIGAWKSLLAVSRSQYVELIKSVITDAWKNLWAVDRSLSAEEILNMDQKLWTNLFGFQY